MYTIADFIVKSIAEKDTSYLNTISHMFLGEDKKAADFIAEYQSKYSAIPDIKIVMNEVPNFAVTKLDVIGELPYVCDSVTDLARKTYAAAHIREVTKDGGFNLAKLDEINKVLQIRPVEWVDWGLYKVDHYANPASKLRFASSALQWFNEQLGGGLSLDEMLLFFARQKQGKSYILAALLYDIVVKGNYRVLTFSNEMATENLLSRFDAMLLATNPNILQSGRLPIDKVERLRKIRKELEGRMTISGQAGSAAQVIAMYEKMNPKPDVIAIDAAELMGKGSDYGQIGASLTAQVYALRLFQLKNNVPILLTTQQNRTGVANDNTDPATIAGSDVFGRAATSVFHVTKVFDGPNEYQRLRCVATRNESIKPDIYMHYDWDTMTISAHNIADGAIEFNLDS